MTLPKVIPYLVWKNVKTNATASIRGAVPYVNEADKLNWITESNGFTIQWPDGRTGIGRKPFESHSEAEQWVTNYVNRIAEAV